MEDYSKYFQFPLGDDQQKAFDALCAFVTDKDNNLFVLRGYAGTGKTSLIGGFIKKLHNDWLASIKTEDVATKQGAAIQNFGVHR